MGCEYCKQMRQRIMTRFRLKRYRQPRDRSQVAVAQSAQIKIRGNSAQGFNEADSLASKAETPAQANIRGF